MSHSKSPSKTKIARAKSVAKRSAKPLRDPPASTRSETKQEAVTCFTQGTPRNDRHDHEGDRLAAPLGPRLSDLQWCAKSLASHSCQRSPMKSASTAS
jgi:hypothetical protein